METKWAVLVRSSRSASVWIDAPVRSWWMVRQSRILGNMSERPPKDETTIRMALFENDQ
jgi:hypothetical protein